ncbi:transcription elongation factor A protein 3 isoform X1 [Stigmatopora nigra]
MEGPVRKVRLAAEYADMTREEDLIRIAKKLEKMVLRNNTDGAMDLLKELKGFNMTLELLQETRIGMSVNSIRKHCADEEVIDLAKVLIKEWKRLLDSSRAHMQKASEEKNALDSSDAAGSPNRRLDFTHRHDSVPDANQPIKDWKAKHTDEPQNKMSRRDEYVDKKQLKEAVKEEIKKPREVENNQPDKKRQKKHHNQKEMREDKKLNEVKAKEDGRHGRLIDTLPNKPASDPDKERPAGIQKPLFERKDSLDSKVAAKQSVDVKKERKNSLDSKLSQPAKHHSADPKPSRRESELPKQNISPSAKKVTSERRESHASKASQAVSQQIKQSSDHHERKGKTEDSKTPSTPTSPISPGFASVGGPLSPRLATGNSIRDKCIEMLTAALHTDNDYKDFGTNCEMMAAEIEEHIYQEIRATDMKYKNRVRSRISNLKDPKNPGLRRNVLAGSIDLNRIATMSAEEMASDELKQLRNVLTQEAIREHQMAKTGGTTTDLLQCGKCKKRNCTYNQVQTRSADEPMTTFVLCNECGNRWKFC